MNQLGRAHAALFSYRVSGVHRALVSVTSCRSHGLSHHEPSRQSNALNVNLAFLHENGKRLWAEIRPGLALESCNCIVF